MTKKGIQGGKRSSGKVTRPATARPAGYPPKKGQGQGKN